MTATWKQDKAWADRFTPEIKSILGQHVFREASPKEDREENTDLMVLQSGNVRASCRIRHFAQYDKYKNQFTIRASRPSGVKTELDKLLTPSQLVEYFFYGFADEQDCRLHCWFLGHLTVFREWWVQEFRRTKIEPGILKSNEDGSSDFRAFLLRDMPSRFVVACSENCAAFKLVQAPPLFELNGSLKRVTREPVGYGFD